MTITTINKTIGYQMNALTVNADGTLIAQYSVGSIDTDGNYKALAERGYVLSPAEAAPILNTQAVEGVGVWSQITQALGTALSQRPDWLA